MPVQVIRNFVIKSGDQTLVLSPEEIQKAVETEVTVTCSGPRCQARNARPGPFSVTWKEEEAAKDPLTLPDAFFQMIKLSANPVKPEELVFCGKICAVDYLNHVYVPPQPPRIALENAKREQAKNLEELNPHLTPGQILAPEQALERGLKATMQKVVQTPEGPQVVPDPETSAKIDAIAETLTFPNAGEYEVEFHTTQTPPVVLPPNSGETLKIVQKTDDPSPVNQADGYPGE